MAQIIREIRVDVSQPNVFQAIVAKQLDCNSRFLKIILVDFGVKIEVPETAKVTINANRPDGKSQSFMGVANNDGTITVPLAQWMLEVAGELKCDVSVINTTDNKRLTSTDFYVNVQEAANKSTDISENPDGEIRVITPTQKIDKNSSDDEYPSAKAVYELDNITTTATGSAITIDSAKAPLQNLKLFGKTTQNGTPTPSAPVPLVSVGDSGSFEVGVYGGENFVDTNGYKIANYYVDAGGKEWVSNYGQTLLFVPIVPNTTYTYTGGASGYGGCCFADSNKQPIGVKACDYANRNTPQTFTTPNNAHYFVIGSYIASNNYQLELGTQATPYEPCNKQTLSMPYTLPSMDTIKQEVDFNKGIIVKKLGVTTITSSDNISISRFTDDTNNNWNTRFFVINKTTDGGFAKNDVVATSDYFPAIVCFDQDRQGIYSHRKGVGIRIDKSLLADVSTQENAIQSFKNWLSDKTVNVVYQLPETIEIPLTETELNAYRHLMTNKGNTTILNSDGADMEISYYVNKPNAQAIGSLHEQINKDYLKLQQAIISTGGSTL